MLPLFIGSVCISWIFAEVILRIIDFSYPLLYQYNDFIGFRLQPQAEGWFRKEGATYITINSDGLRDEEHTKQKPPGTFRIAILGDSYAEAFQVPLQETFWKVLEYGLTTCNAFGEKGIEVINFGVSGYGTAQEYLTLQHYVWDYSPDMVLLAFLTGNDIRNNSKTLEPSSHLIPFFRLHNGELLLDNSFLTDPEYLKKTSWLWSLRRRIYSYSRLYQLISKTKDLYLYPVPDPLSLLEGEELGLDDRIYIEPQTSEWQEAWEITEKLLIKIHQEVKGRNARLLVVTLANGIQVHPDSEVRQRYMQTKQIQDLFYPDNRIKAFAEQAGIEVLTLAPELQKYAEKNQVYLHGFENTIMGFGHWNTHGHRIVGQKLTEYLCRPPR